MKCDEALALLAAEADGEIDGLRGYALRRHLAVCPACTAQHQELLALRQQLASELTYFAAPSALHARLRVQHAPSGAAARTPAAAWRGGRAAWFGAGAIVASAAFALVLNLAPEPAAWRSAEDLPSQLVALHTHAMLGKHLVDVASSDRHTVKPWLSARLDYAIPVQDWAPVGFPLVGARIDRLDRRDVATLVYRHRDHVIDVFVRPDATSAATPAPRTVRGFNVAAANGAEMQWLATSDLDAETLAAFVRGLARGDSSELRQ